MIQRIQSVWLFLAALTAAFAVCPTLARFAKDGGYFDMTSIGYQTISLPPETSLPALPWGVLCFTAVLVVLPIVTLFLYKNRRRQLQLTTWNVAAVVGWYVTWVAYAVSFANNTQTDFSPSVAAAIPLLSLVFILLARRGVQKDEALVRAADRIR